MLFTREPIDILLFTPVKYARPHYDVKMSGDIDLVRIIESKHWPRHPEQETHLRADNTNNRLPSEPSTDSQGIKSVFRFTDHSSSLLCSDQGWEVTQLLPGQVWA